VEEKIFAPPPRRPNVLWIFGDQHRAQATGYRGDPNVATPNLDNLGRQGVRFDCAVAGAPWCAPFRGALISGRYPHQNGVVCNGIALPPSAPTVATAFNAAGYHTAYIGKWHLDGAYADEARHYVPPERRGGFDYWMGNEASNNQHEHYVFGTGHEEPFRLQGYVTDGFSDLLIDHVREHVGAGPDYQPFFAALSVQPPHGPTVTPTNPAHGGKRITPADIQLRRNVPSIPWLEEQARYDLSGYYGQIENLDYNVGRIRQALIDMGVDRETYVIFFSDHGEMGGSHAQFDKRSPHEESIRIPFIVHRGGGMNGGISDAVINHVDIAPTSLGLCGIAVPEAMVGHDYSAQCISSGAAEHAGPAHPKAEPQSAYLQQVPPRPFAVGPNGEAPSNFIDCVNVPWRGVATRDGWKYVCTPGADWQLFNVVEDPYEQANHIFNERFRTQKERCHRLLREWIANTGDDFQLPDIGLTERGTPAEQYHRKVAQRSTGRPETGDS
jgi:arylsulfatase A-like enzyme